MQLMYHLLNPILHLTFLSSPRLLLHFQSLRCLFGCLDLLLHLLGLHTHYGALNLQSLVFILKCLDDILILVLDLHLLFEAVIQRLSL